MTTLQEAQSAGLARVSASFRWAWSIGSIGVQVMLTAIPYFMLFYFVNVLGLDPAFAGVILFVGKIIDLVAYPMIGSASDRTRSRLGRRRPYLLAGGLLSGMTFFGLFNVPEALAGVEIRMYVCIALFLYSLGLALFTVPYLAQPSDTDMSEMERSRLLGFRSYFLFAGIFIGGPVGGYIIKMFGQGREAYQALGAIGGIFVVTTMMVSFAGTANSGAVAAPLRHGVRLRDAALRFARDRLLLALGMVHFLQIFSAAATQAVLLFFFAMVIQRGTDALTLYGGVILVTGLLSVRLWMAAGTRYGNLRCYLAGMWLYTASVLSWLIASPDEATIVFICRAALAGVGSAASMVNGQALLVGAVREESRRSSAASEAVMVSAIAVFEKMATAVGPLMVGLLLSAGGFDKARAMTAQPPEAVGAVWISLVATAAFTMLIIHAVFLGFGLLSRDGART